MMVWRVQLVGFAYGPLESWLNDGWEPFAVTRNSLGVDIIWLRKLVELDD